MIALVCVLAGALIVVSLLLVVVLVAYHERPRVVLTVTVDDANRDPAAVAARVQNHLDHLRSTRRDQP